ncbi:Extradiol ring-cleavage dioxygenase class III protein subunit B, partial [mine drainage metagenome]
WPGTGAPVFFYLVLPEDPDLDHWWQMGERLAPLLDRPYLWIGSGGVVHNLMKLDWSRRFGSGAEWAEAFADWVTDALARGDRERITHPLAGPGGAWALPTSDHYAPLVLVAALAEPATLVPLYKG